MKEWFRETHGPGFELLRHFVRRFFDSDLVTTPGQMTTVLIGALPVFFQWFLLFIMPLHRKYEHLTHLSTPHPYREAVRADELWLITLMMSAVGLLTAIKWQSLFPDLRDYRALGALPLRSWQIFAAKLAALLVVAAGVMGTLNFLPSFGFPALSAGRWAFQSSLAVRVWAHAGASLAACAFFFFGLIALQGVLLNLLPPRVFGRVTGYLQGCLVAVMLGLLVMSFSVEARITNMLLQPEWARWLPPVWFLGLYQSLSGDPDSAMRVLANRAEAALAFAVVLTLLTYLISYRRHQALLVEGINGRAKDSRFGSKLHWLLPNPRQQAVVSFMTQTLARSSYHRMIVIGYAGLALALILTGFIGLGNLLGRFLYLHMIVLLFLLIGARHLFALPTELKANWIFQITEREGRGAWLHAVDRFVLFWGAALLLVIPFPLEARLLGWRGVAEPALFLLLGLLTYEWAFSSWEKMPFTCSHLPGKTPIWMIMAVFGLIGGMAMLHSLLLATLYNNLAFAAVCVGLLAAWMRVHHTRRQGWAALPLKYDELPEPAVQELRLLR
jgi:hypothetical protein